MTEKERKIKRSEYSRNYYERNRETILEKVRAYRQAHQEEYRAYMRAYMKAYRKIKNRASSGNCKTRQSKKTYQKYTTERKRVQA